VSGNLGDNILQAVFFQRNFFCAAFMYIKLVLVFFCRKDIIKNASLKILAILTLGLIIYFRAEN